MTASSTTRAPATSWRSIYKTQGLKMLGEHATHSEGGFGVEAGITEMLTRMQTGRFKVFREPERLDG